MDESERTLTERVTIALNILSDYDLDENLGDTTERFDTLLYILSNGDAGQDWGHGDRDIPDDDRALDMGTATALDCAKIARDHINCELRAIPHDGNCAEAIAAAIEKKYGVGDAK
jgi:hypothetical protein